MAATLKTVLRDLHALAMISRGAGIALTWYAAVELHGLDPEEIESLMTLAANEFIECNALPTEPQQLPLDLDVSSDERW